MQKFSKAIRLRKKTEYDRALNAGMRRATPNLVVIASKNSDGCARLGLIVSRKVGNAVCRNRVKRYIREIFRQTQSTLPVWDIVVIARPSAKESTFHRLAEDFLGAIKKLQNSRQRQPA